MSTDKRTRKDRAIKRARATLEQIGLYLDDVAKAPHDLDTDEWTDRIHVPLDEVEDYLAEQLPGLEEVTEENPDDEDEDEEEEGSDDDN